MRIVKATLLGLIAVSLVMMWSSRHYVTAAYQQTPDTPELRLSGIDLAVTRTAVAPSPFIMPAAPDTRRRHLPAVPTVEPATVAAVVSMADGSSRLRGVVVGPDGPIAGAVVGLERHTSHGLASRRVSTDVDGKWSISRLPGGRYRVRSWLPGLMTMGGSELVFLAEDETADFTFSLWGVDPLPTMEFIHGGPIYEGLSSTVAVAVSQRSVDEDGLVVTSPMSAVSVSVQVSPEVSITSSPIQFTDHQGTARFVLACVPAQPVSPSGQGAAAEPDGSASSAGHGTLTARSGVTVASFALPGCRPIPVAAADDQPEAPSGG